MNAVEKELLIVRSSSEIGQFSLIIEVQGNKRYSENFRKALTFNRNFEILTRL